MLHQKIGAVFFGRDGVRIGFGHALYDLDIGDVEFESAVRALVGANFAFNDNAGFLRQCFYRIEDFRSDRILGNNALDNARTVAELGKKQLPALAQIVEPAANGDRLAFMLADFGDGGDRSHKEFRNWVIWELSNLRNIAWRNI